jgi:membrane protease YdiL (CAAX protease family)
MMDPYRPPDQGDESPRAPFTPVRAMAWMAGSFLLMVLFAVVYFYFNEQAASDLVGLGIVSAASFLLMSAFLIGRYPGGLRLAEPLGVRSSHPLAVFLGLLVGLSAKVPAEQISHYIDAVWPRSEEEVARIAAMFEGHSALHRLALFFVIALLVPIAEEIFFRGAVYGALRRSKTSEYQAALVTALGFTLCHADVRQLVPILFVALLLGALRTFSGSLLPGLAAHVGFNGAAILGATYELLPEVHELSLEVRVAATGALGLLLYLLITMVGKHPRAQAARREEARSISDETAPDAQVS